ncbi:hypothetical protein MASR2M74_26390 [Paracoccaceae bacterium]
MKILLVDDDPVFQDILTHSLRALGHEDITKATSAADALVTLQVQTAPFDCILLDIQMPGMDGVSLCQVLRGLPDYRRVPIVMVTSLSAKRFIDDAFAAGATDYVTKPLDRLDLKARLGMVERLVEERLHVELLTRQAGRRNEAAHAEVEFESAIHIPEFDRGIELLALENYLLTLGRKGTLSMAAFGFHIENANVIYGKASRSAFVDMLSDVGLIISDAIKTDDVHLAYAGAGNFVGVTSKGLSSSSEEISAMIEIGLADFDSFYSSQRLPTPRVRVGPLCRSPLFSLGKPTRILERAIQLAHHRSGHQAHVA